MTVEEETCAPVHSAYRRLDNFGGIRPKSVGLPRSQQTSPGRAGAFTMFVKQLIARKSVRHGNNRKQTLCKQRLSRH